MSRLCRLLFLPFSQQCVLGKFKEGDAGSMQNVNYHYHSLTLGQSKRTFLKSNARVSVATDKARQRKEKETLCPACGIAPLDQWSCKLVCHVCGLRFTYDEWDELIEVRFSLSSSLSKYERRLAFVDTRGQNLLPEVESVKK